MVCFLRSICHCWTWAPRMQCFRIPGVKSASQSMGLVGFRLGGAVFNQDRHWGVCIRTASGIGLDRACPHALIMRQWRSVIQTLIFRSFSICLASPFITDSLLASAPSSLTPLPVSCSSGPRASGQMDVLLRRAGAAALQLARRQRRITHNAWVWRHKLPAATLAAGRSKSGWPVAFSPDELRRRLSPVQYHVTQERGTERAFTGEFTDHKEDGTYTCAVCNTPLFPSDKKFDSGSGWPSFCDVVSEESVTLTDDFSYAMHRVETSCSKCGSHLGHLFEDGPPPTGQRYCINSASLTFQPKEPAPPGASGTGTGTS